MSLSTKPSAYAVFGLNPTKYDSGLQTVVQSLYSHYPVKLIAPNFANPRSASVLGYTSTASWLYIINYGGGLVPGDHPKITIECRSGCTGLLTTQGYNLIFSNRQSDISGNCVISNSSQETGSSQEFRHYAYPKSLIVIAPQPTLCLEDATHQHTQYVNLYWDLTIDDDDDHNGRSSNVISPFRLDEIGSTVVIEWLGAGRLGCSECWDFMRFESVNQIVIEILQSKQPQIPTTNEECLTDQRLSSTSEDPTSEDPISGSSLNNILKNNYSEVDQKHCNQDCSIRQPQMSITICREALKLNNDEGCTNRLMNQMSPYTCLGVCIVMGPRVASLIMSLKNEFKVNRQDSFHRHFQWRSQHNTNADDVADRHWMQPVVVTCSSMKRNLIHPKSRKKKCLEGLMIKFLGTSIPLVNDKITTTDDI